MMGGLGSRGTQDAQTLFIPSNTDVAGRGRATSGGKYGPRNPALAVGRTHSENHPTRAVLALIANPSAYYVDTLFRSDHRNANATDRGAAAETARILAMGIRNGDGDVPAGDKTYLARLVAARTGLSQADAEKRVDDVIGKAKAAETKARQIADATRKAGASPP